jgi:hypothetical protein
LSGDIARMLVTDFLKSSWQCVETIVRGLVSFKERENGSKKRNVNLFHFKNRRRNDITVEGWRFFLRSSVEYSNPQLTIEEVQGIIAARLLEASGNHFYSGGLHEADGRDIDAICERLKKPPEGLILPFLLNTDDIEPDRYSMNPLKESIVKSGQSAFPSATVTTEGLEIDQKFAQKYGGSLICSREIQLIASCLETCGKSYTDMVDTVKCEQMEHFSESFGIDLRLPIMRLPLVIMEKETTEGLLHRVIRELHKDYKSVERAYGYIGRSMKNRTTLLTIPHSQKGYGSKRAVKGKIYFSGTKLKSVKVDYGTTPLYPNAMDPADVSVAVADDHFMVEGDRLVNYSFGETPSSPQFFLYILASPEDAALWHGIGAFGASQLVKSYITVRSACSTDLLIKDLNETYGIAAEIPLQFNLVPEHMWAHPLHHNIDASVGCVENLSELAKRGMKIETLPAAKLIRV